ncbi:DUF6495 family protein [Altibacter sp. HG106]|uniref:DUF6495 family protein n=1 Tax=Altibacter sp. HG106 TaxID=3023937 RepID=UPI00234FBAC9|nr:DUF6495 family protein [Altibacter sp. HG106]MDC7993727.1 DUF6495 family protein [Altibacter sp. HG106]
MKYARLTKEQLEELHEEFIRFLATQSITGDEWKQLKENKPQVAEAEIDVFSDLVWEGVLEKAEYLENMAPQQLFLFKINTDDMTLIALKIMDNSKDITTVEGYRWLQQHYASEAVEFYTATKTFSEDKKADIFSLIEKGAIITKGELYRFFEKMIDA